MASRRHRGWWLPVGREPLIATVLLLRTRPPLHHRGQAIDKPRAIVVRFIALLLIGTTLHFLFSLIAVNFGDHWWLANPRWGVYAAEYIAFAAWLAWGPPTALCRIAVVTLLGISWMLGTWAGLWAADPMYRRGFGGERLGVFTLAPLALVLGTLPLAAMRTWFRLVAPLSRSSRNNSANVVSILTVACVGAVIIAAHRVRGPDLHWDIWIAAQIAIILGVIAAATAPLLAWGFLRGEVRPIPILLACLAPAPLAALASRFYGMPGPGAAGVVHATSEAAAAAIVTTVCLCVTFACWRFLGIRVASTQKAEPGVGADSR